MRQFRITVHTWPIALFRGRAATRSLLERSGHQLAAKTGRSVANDPEQTWRAVAQTSPVVQTLMAPVDKID
jgi:hypothetical protein